MRLCLSILLAVYCFVHFGILYLITSLLQQNELKCYECYEIELKTKVQEIFDCLGESPPEIYVDGPLSEMLNPINGQEMR